MSSHSCYLKWFPMDEHLTDILWTAVGIFNFFGDDVLALGQFENVFPTIDDL